ncbi:MAG TPA: FliH/SctL family protein [Gryllotalpicola sp.]
MTDIFESLAFAHVIGGAEDTTARREAELRGYADGYAAGARRAERMLEERSSALEERARSEREAAQRAATARLERLDLVTAALGQRAEQRLADARQALLQAAIELAEALLGQELADGTTSARAIARRVLAAEEAAAITRLRVHPAEVPAVAALLAPRPVEVVADPALDRGDAVAELPAGFLDVRITAALSRVRRALSDGVDAGQDEQGTPRLPAEEGAA